MGRAVALLMLLVAGCIRPELTTCDDIACPVGTVCHPRVGCALPEQLTACTGSDEGSPCEYRGTPGACVDGICEALDCGNNLITPGEVCDDGNTINGDGCSADCRSDETCGNNSVDIAAGEQCDDGNLIDADGCSAGCLLPRCGDGILDSFEECDPAQALQTTRTCEDFSFYTGSLSCNAICRLDPSPGCTGTCGDQIIQPAFEDCDGTPQSATCLDFGYDLGALTCSLGCAMDPVRSCNRFGWLDLGAAPVNGKFRGDGETRVVFIGSVLLIFEPAGNTSIGGSFVGADVLGDAILYATSTAVYLRPSAGAAFAPLPAPTIPTGATITDAVLADDGTPFALLASASMCEVHAFTANAWTVRMTTTRCEQIVAKAVDNFAIKINSNAIEWAFPGGARSTGGGPIHSMELRGPNLLIYSYDNVTMTVSAVPPVGPGSGGRTVVTGNYYRIVRSGDDFFGIDTATFGVTLTRIAYGGNELAPGAPSTNGAPNDVYVSRDGKIYGSGNARLHALEFLSRTNRIHAAAGNLVTRSSIGIATDGTLLSCGPDVWSSSGPGWTRLSPTSGNGCTALWGRSNVDFYVARDLTGPNALYRWNGVSFTQELYSGSPINASKLAGDGSTVIAQLSTGEIARKTVGWEILPPLPATCAAAAIAIASGTVWAAGSCGAIATLWRLEATTWVEVHAQPSIGGFTSLLVLGGTIYAASSTATVVIGTEGGTWTAHPGAVSQLAGTSSGVFGVDQNLLKRWDGQRWSPIRTANNIRQGAIAASARDLIMIGSTFPAPTPIQWFGYLLPP